MADALSEALVDWAKSRNDIAGIVLVGSRARGTAQPDSDFDFVIMTDRPAAYVSESRWVEGFGSVRAIYASGDEAEFGLTGPEWASVPLDAGTRAVISDGSRFSTTPGASLGGWKKAISRAST